MPARKVLLIGPLACVCFASAISTLLAPMIHDGNPRWVWMGGSLAATVHGLGVLDLPPVRQPLSGRQAQSGAELTRSGRRSA